MNFKASITAALMLLHVVVANRTVVQLSPFQASTNCAALASDGVIPSEAFLGFRLESCVPDGTYYFANMDQGTCTTFVTIPFADEEGANSTEYTVTINATTDASRSTITWSTSNFQNSSGIDAVIMQGNVDANVYVYEPPVTSDGTPLEIRGATVNSIEFCWTGSTGTTSAMPSQLSSAQPGPLPSLAPSSRSLAGTCVELEGPKNILFNANLSAGDLVQNVRGFDLTATNCGFPMIFDSGNPTGGDFDLETIGGNNLLIVSEDCDSSDPDDIIIGGGTITFVPDGVGGFNAFHVNRICLIDIDENEARLIGTSVNKRTFKQDIERRGDGVLFCIPVDFKDEYLIQLKVVFFGSGAIERLNVSKFRCNP